MLLLWSYDFRTDYLARDILVMNKLTYYHNDESINHDTISYCAYYVSDLVHQSLARRAKVKFSDRLSFSSVL